MSRYKDAIAKLNDEQQNQLFGNMRTILQVLLGNEEFAGDSNKILMEFFSDEYKSEFFYEYIEELSGIKTADVCREIVKDLQRFENGTIIRFMSAEEAESHRQYIKTKGKEKLSSRYY